MNVEPISEQKPKGCSSIFFVFFGGVFFLSGMIFFWLVFLGPFWRTHTSSDWVETPCTVIKSKVDVDNDGDGTTYRPRVEFEYTFDEKEYVSDTYDFTELNRSKARCKEVVSAYPVDMQTSCFVDPNDHQRAVITRNYDFTLFAFLFPLIFVAIGLAVALGSLFYKGSKSDAISGSASASSVPSGVAASSLSGATQTTSLSAHPGDIEDANWDQPQKLKPSQKRVMTFLFTLFAAIFWNGIIGFFIYGMVADGMDNLAIIPMLFMIPFILVGIAIIGGVLYTFAAIFNPTVELALTTGAIERGGSVDVAWQLEGRTSIVKSLKITVEGEESATYRRGTDTITDKNIFCTIPIAEVTDPQDIEFGSGNVTIPADTMHTFASDRNKITWQVVVHGDIPYWPDVKETYEFRVKP